MTVRLTTQPGAGLEYEAQRQWIIDCAALAHAQYPQYEGHWDGDEWQLVRFRKRVRTKLGVAFEPGDITIACPPQRRDEHDTHPTAYSWRNGIDTSVYAKDYEEVART